MNTRYKLILSNKSLYEEIDVPSDCKKITIGTDLDCDYRLRKEDFFEQFGLTVTQNEKKLTLSCSENLYLTVGDVRKLVMADIEHGDELTVKYRESDSELLKAYFTIDFEYEKKDYSKVIDISETNCIAIGGADKCAIRLTDSNLGKDYFEIENNKNRVFVRDIDTRYGTFLNGIRINGSAEVFDGDFISIIGFSFYYKKGKLYTDKNQKMEISAFPCKVIKEQTSHFEYPDFNLNTRIQYVIPEEEIEIKQPPQKPQKNKRSLWLTILPTLGMLVLLIVVRGFLSGSTGTGGSFILYSAGSMGIGLAVSLLTYRADNKQYEKDVADREADYAEYIEQKEKEIQESRENELRIRNNIYASLNDSLNEAIHFEKRLFEKTKNDKDFLDVYLGRGRIEAACKIKYTKQDFIDKEDPITLIPEQLEEKYKYIEDAPIVAHLRDASALGVVGDEACLRQAMKNITLDICLRHYYADVKTVYIMNEESFEGMEWLRWLRHTHNDALNIRNFMCDEESGKIITEMLYSELSHREALKNEDNEVEFECHYVVFVRNAKAISQHPMSKYVESASELGFSFIFFENYEEYLPKGCKEIVRLEDKPGCGAVLKSENGDEIYPFICEDISNRAAEKAATKIGAVYIPEVSLEGELTKSITLFEMLGLFSTDDLNLDERWGSSQVYKSMAAPLGIKAKNEIVYLDISDKASAHGPHGLVAGTTGSGKSEILQAYVLSMATLFHPYDVGFVIIDFKGGGMSNQFKDLPHLIGTITNIDGREINRSLLSIKAELVKRQNIFKESGVNHINDYIKLYKKGEVSVPLPHLIMIVDEFAELKAEYPDFMKEIISAARIGRTLGVHLILATQKPAGVVDNQIWSNSKFKLCLKVQTKEDSNEVIKTPLAAEIKEPGRAYFQVGNNEVFELFQSAYSGGKVKEGNNEQIVELFELNRWGKRKLVYTNKEKKSREDAPTELEAIVQYVKDYCDNNFIKRLNGICLPPLEDSIRVNALSRFEKDISKGIIVPIGVYDDPENQIQEEFKLNVSSSNTYIIGSPQSGKTTALQTIILQIMQFYSPEECSIYIVDCGGMALKTFETSKHVGGVVIATEEERMSNLFKMIMNAIQKRKQIFASQGLGTYSAYIEAGFSDVPQMILVIDNLAAFREYYGIYDDLLLSISREGQSVGINIIATATQTNTLNYKVLSNFGNRIAYTCNDSGEYTNLFDRCRMVPKEVPGRGLCSIEKHIVEFQTALSVYGDKEIERVQNVRNVIEQINKRHECAAMPIPEVPKVLKRSDILKKDAQIYRRPYEIPFGMDYDTVSYVYINLLQNPAFGVCGKGTDNMLKHMLNAIQLNVFGSLTEAYIIDGNELVLDACSSLGCVEKYSIDLGETEEILDSILDQLKERQQEIVDNRYSMNSYLEDKPLLLLLINNNSFYSLMAESKDLQKKLEEITKTYSRLKVAVVYGNFDNAPLNYNSPEFLKQLKDSKKLIMFEDITNIRFVDIPTKEQKENAKPLVSGDAFTMFDGGVKRIKTILDE